MKINRLISISILLFGIGVFLFGISATKVAFTGVTIIERHEVTYVSDIDVVPPTNEVDTVKNSN